jgi:hypothetical protein
LRIDFPSEHEMPPLVRIYSARKHSTQFSLFKQAFNPT